MKRLWLVGGFVALVGLAATGVALLWPKPIIPIPIKSQLTSTLLLPDAADIQLDRTSPKYDAKLKLLSYNVKAFGVLTVFSEQPTPDSFTDIPQTYDKVTQSMNEYAKFDVDTGTVHLTRPKQLAGKQAAVLNTKGTLLFAKPDRDLSEDQWRKLFNSLTVAK